MLSTLHTLSYFITVWEHKGDRKLDNCCWYTPEFVDIVLMRNSRFSLTLNVQNKIGFLKKKNAHANLAIKPKLFCQVFIAYHTSFIGIVLEYICDCI